MRSRGKAQNAHACTHHPGVTSSSIDEPPRDLAGSLDDEQGAEALEQLEDGAGVSQQAIPTAQHDRLQHAVLAKEPLGPASAPGLEDAAHGPLDPVRGAGVDGKLTERPYQHGGYGDPLQQAKGEENRVSYTRLVGGYDLDGGVEEVEDEEREAVGQPAVTTTDIEGDGDGEYDADEKDRTEEHAE